MTENLKLVDLPFGPILNEENTKRAAYRKRNSRFSNISIHPADIDTYKAQGWEVQREGKTSTRLKKLKKFSVNLEDHMWCLLYRMGFAELNDLEFKVRYKRADGTVGEKQIDCFARDEETIFIIECKSRKARGLRKLQKDIQETVSLQDPIRKEVFKAYPRESRPKIVWIYSTNNIAWSAADVERATANNIGIITENELFYFDAFVKHIGPAGKFQIVSEFLKGQKIPRLENQKLPAIRGKIGGYTFYYFVTTPRQLLKISFINHQALNHPDGKPAYQRMISSSRVKKIGTFIENGGFFPTNLLINFTEKPKFDLIDPKANLDPDIKFGWVHLPNKYRSAWIIDGQHRLYGFSHLDNEYWGESLFVLAFEKMATVKEADLFITINHEQKSVPRSVLVGLMADLKIDSENPKERITALSSAIAKSLNSDKGSPFFQRMAVHGIPPQERQNLTIPETVNGLVRSQLIGKISNKIFVPGPFYLGKDADTIKRATNVINGYFDAYRQSAPTRWEDGRAAFISINPGVRAHLMLMAEAVTYLSYTQGVDFSSLSDDEFIRKLNVIAAPIGVYVRKASRDILQNDFGRKFGEGGVREYLFRLYEIVAAKYPNFGSAEFKKFVKQKSDDRNDWANNLIIKLTQHIIDYVIRNLKGIYGTKELTSGEKAYWELGIEKDRIKKNAFDKQLAAPQDQKLPKEAYLDIVDIIEIIKSRKNWLHFEPVFNIPMGNEKNGKTYYLDWMNSFNELRRIPAHKTSLRNYEEEDFEFLSWIESEFFDRLSKHSNYDEE